MPGITLVAVLLTKNSTMKQIQRSFAAIILMIASFFFALPLLAQDKGTNIDVDVNKGGDWYTQPWVWIVGGAIFVLLLLALLRGNRTKD